MNFSHDEQLNDIANRVETSSRLSFADGLALYATDDSAWVRKTGR